MVGVSKTRLKTGFCSGLLGCLLLALSASSSSAAALRCGSSFLPLNLPVEIERLEQKLYRRGLTPSELEALKDFYRSIESESPNASLRIDQLQVIAKTPAGKSNATQEPEFYGGAVPTRGDVARSTEKIAGLSWREFPKHDYVEAANFYKLRVVNAAMALRRASSEMTPEALDKILSNLEHLKNHERNIRARYQEYLDQGINPERIIAAIWAHDLGKFLPPHINIKVRHAIRRALADPNFRAPEAIKRDKRKLRQFMIDHPELLEKYRNPMAEGLDHAETSKYDILENPVFSRNGRPDNMSRQIALDIFFHDGPAAPGSFWGDLYQAITGRKFRESQTREGQALRVSDRADQVYVSLDTTHFSGGFAKIIRERAARDLGNIGAKEVIRQTLKTLADGTEAQVKWLIEASQSDQPLAWPEPVGMYSLIMKRIDTLRALDRDTVFYEEPKPNRSIGYVLVDGMKIEFATISDYAGNLMNPGAVGRWWENWLKTHVTREIVQHIKSQSHETKFKDWEIKAAVEVLADMVRDSGHIRESEIPRLARLLHGSLRESRTKEYCQHLIESTRNAWIYFFLPF